MGSLNVLCRVVPLVHYHTIPNWTNVCLVYCAVFSSHFVALSAHQPKLASLRGDCRREICHIAPHPHQLPSYLPRAPELTIISLSHHLRTKKPPT